jgi:hypothetical protein
MKVNLRIVTINSWRMCTSGRKGRGGAKNADCRFLIVDLSEHGAWSLEHGVKKQKTCLLLTAHRLLLTPDT